jgi:hypothetical protein
MKKRNLKNLKLNKRYVSKLKIDYNNNIKGGSATCYFLICAIAASVVNGTDGDCVPTWGDPGCLTGIDALCKLQ